MAHKRFRCMTSLKPGVHEIKLWQAPCTEKMALALYSGGLKYHAFPGITGISLKKELDLKLVLSCILKSKIGHPDEMNI